MSTKERLVEAATSLFAEQGYNATGMADILEKAAVHRGSLYHAFRAKKDLLVAVLEGYHSGIQERLLEPAWQSVSDPIEQVFALLGRYRQFLEDSGYLFGCPVGSLALELRDPEPEVREALAANFRNWAAHVEVCFQAAVDRFQPGTDARELAIFTLTTMEGGVMLARTFRSIEPFDTSVRSLRRYIRGLLRDPSSCPEV